MSGVEGLEREDLDDREAGVKFGAAAETLFITEAQRHGERYFVILFSSVDSVPPW
jgi:hypothetical protein